MDEPNFYRVIAIIPIDRNLIGAAFNDQLYLLNFRTSDLEQPTAEPIGIFYRGGTRRYVWRDKFWCDYDLPAHPILQSATPPLDADHTAWMAMMNGIRSYMGDHGPSSNDFWRVIYEIQS